jgi:hypothetical protein
MGHYKIMNQMKRINYMINKSRETTKKRENEKIIRETGNPTTKTGMKLFQESPELISKIVWAKN